MKFPDELVSGELSARARNCIINHARWWIGQENVTLDDLRGIPEAEWLRIPGIGLKYLNEIITWLGHVAPAPSPYIWMARPQVAYL